MQSEVLRPAPVDEASRIVPLDVLRGAAILGILVMNIQSFAMPGAVYLNPTAWGDLSGANGWIWWISHVFFDGKFISIFSMLFGAGIALFADRIEARGGRPAPVHYRRMGWLVLIGLAHAYLLWHGDILFSYGVTGLLAYLFRRWRPWRLIVLGILLLALGSGFQIGLGGLMNLAPADAVRQMDDEVWRPTPEAIDREIAAFRGGWTEQLGERVPEAFLFETWVYLMLFSWKTGGLMLIGMALLRLGVLSGRRSSAFYAGLAVGGAAIGLPLIGYGIIRNFEAGWDVRYSFFFGSQYNWWGSVPVALAWIGLFQLAAGSSRLAPLAARLGAVGRMALTNYLLQTVLCTTIFYGHGLGLFARLERSAQIGVVLGVWAVELAISLPWLWRFRFGPAEWAWRSLTYWKRQPFKRKEDP